MKWGGGKLSKGFTLIELLAVIVIIAVIALITIPIIVNTVEKSKKNALVDSAYGILKAGNLYYMEEMSKKEETERYDFKVSEGKFVLETNSKETLKFTGKMPKTGILQIHSNGDSAIGICTDTYCACKSVSELKVTLKDSNCNINSETGEIEKEESSIKIKELEEKISALETSKTELDKKVIGLETRLTASEKKQVVSGTVITYLAGTSVPEGYLACDGKVYNISAYPDLANAIKKGFGRFNYYGGNGSSTFAVPDLRGEFLRGTGTNGHSGQGSGSSVGTHQDATKHTHMTMYDGNLEVHTETEKTDTSLLITGDSFTSQAGYTSVFNKNYGFSYNPRTLFYTSRPTNTSVLYAIKY